MEILALPTSFTAEFAVDLEDDDFTKPTTKFSYYF